MKSEPTLQAMLRELRVIIQADLLRLDNLYQIYENRDQIESIDLEGMPVTQNMRVLFDYAVNARIDRNFPLNDVFEDLTDFFLEIVPRSPMIDHYLSEPIEGFCVWIVDTAIVRWQLDFDQTDSFSIKQLATLANMDERSVRNAANPKNPEPLKTYRAVDGSTSITRDDAIAWLEGRRSYKPTIFIDEDAERDLEHGGFKDLFDLGMFIKQESESQGKSLSQLLQDAGLEQEYSDWLAGKGGEHFSFDVDRFRRIAKALGKDERTFSVAVCKAYQKAELAWLEIKLRR